MDPDQLKQAWQAQPSQARLTTDAAMLLQEVRRNQRHFTATIFWRDFREVGTCLLLLPLWFYLGARHASPWTWYLAVPALLWIAGFLLVDRLRQKARAPRPSETLRQCVASSLAQVQHQIGLLRRVLWWYLLPLALPLLAYVGQLAWQERTGGWRTALAISLVVALVAVVFGAVYWLNQYVVRSGLEPRRRELETLLASFEDERTAER